MVGFAPGYGFVAVAGGLGAALLGDAGVVFPEVFLTGHAFYGGAFLGPDGADVEENVGFPVALLGLVGFEQEDGWGADDGDFGLVTVGLGEDAGVLGEVGHGGVVVVVDVLLAVGEHEGGADRSEQGAEAEQGWRVEGNWVVAEVPELNVVDPEGRCGGLGLVLAGGFHAVEGHALLAPEFRRFAALAVGQAHHRHLHALLGVQGYGAAGAPDEVGGVGADDEGRGHAVGSGSGGVPRVWNEGVVCRPQAWPLLRSAWVQVTGMWSGARISRAPALASSTRLPPGSKT